MSTMEIAGLCMLAPMLALGTVCMFIQIWLLMSSYGKAGIAVGAVVLTGVAGVTLYIIGAT